MKAKTTLGLLAVVGLLISGCENLGAGIDIVNQTDQELYFYTTPIPPYGGLFRYQNPDCSHGDLQLRTKDGQAYATLTEQWCPGQTWTITGKNAISLVDD